VPDVVAEAWMSWKQKLNVGTSDTPPTIGLEVSRIWPQLMANFIVRFLRQHGY
jgi:hypothetical protein